MKQYRMKYICLLVVVLLSGDFFLSSQIAKSAFSSQIRATVAVGVCGNNLVEFGEQCDGSALDGQTCESLGYDGGTLSCATGCDFNLSECVNLGPDEGSIVFSGKAYPMSVIRILKDGQIAATTAADNNGNFETTLSHLVVGSYLFSVYAYDNNGEKSKTLVYQKNISKDEIGVIANIILPPTLAADTEAVIQGEKINLTGQSVALSPVNIFIESSSGIFSRSAISNSEGFYSFELDTDYFDLGDYTVRAKTILSEVLSSTDSEEVPFRVLAKPPPIGQTNVVDNLSLVGWKCAPMTIPRKPMFSGTTNISEALVKIEIRDRKNKKRYVIAETQADAFGHWTWKIPARLKRKHYLLRITLIDQNDPNRNYSYLQAFKIVTKIRKSIQEKCQDKDYSPAAKLMSASSLSQAGSTHSSDRKRADLNGDSRVNLIDYSILSDWIGRSDFPAQADLNADGKLDVQDVSILMYYWTG